MRNLIMIALGTMLYALGYTLFLLPNHLASGGLSGICAILFYATGLEVEYSYAVFNVILLAIGLRILGLRFCLKTMYGVACCTLWLWLWQRLIEMGGPALLNICDGERFMAVILGSLMEGFALAICFANNGSTGGTDIIAACVNKYKDVSLGQIILACDILIISSCYFIFDDVQMVLFGYVLMAVSAITLDYLTRWMHQSVEFKIFSRNYAPIADAIIKAGFGVTVVDGQGWFTKTERKMLVCVVRKRHDTKIARIVKRVDPFAFLMVTNVEGVYGEGFDVMKTKVEGQKPIVVCATNDEQYISLTRSVLGDKYEVRSLADIGCRTEIPLEGDTLEAKAASGIRFIDRFYGFDSIVLASDDEVVNDDSNVCIAMRHEQREYFFSGVCRDAVSRYSDVLLSKAR